MREDCFLLPVFGKLHADCEILMKPRDYSTLHPVNVSRAGGHDVSAHVKPLLDALAKDAGLQDRGGLAGALRGGKPIAFDRDGIRIEVSQALNHQGRPTGNHQLAVSTGAFDKTVVEVDALGGRAVSSDKNAWGVLHRANLGVNEVLRKEAQVAADAKAAVEAQAKAAAEIKAKAEAEAKNTATQSIKYDEEGKKLTVIHTNEGTGEKIKVDIVDHENGVFAKGYKKGGADAGNISEHAPWGASHDEHVDKLLKNLPESVLKLLGEAGAAFEKLPGPLKKLVGKAGSLVEGGVAVVGVAGAFASGNAAAAEKEMGNAINTAVRVVDVTESMGDVGTAVVDGVKKGGVVEGARAGLDEANRGLDKSRDQLTDWLVEKGGVGGALHEAVIGDKQSVGRGATRHYDTSNQTRRFGSLAGMKKENAFVAAKQTTEAPLQVAQNDASLVRVQMNQTQRPNMAMTLKM